jgi:small subunit ribosomal protein S20
MANEPTKSTKVKMPTAQKRDLQNERKRIRNRSFKATVRTVIRGFEEALNGTDSAVTTEQLSNAYSALDKAAKRGIVSKNKANRSKARLAARAALAAK